MGPIRVKDYQDLVFDLLKRHGLGPETLKPVPSVYDWAKKERVPESKLCRVSRAVRRRHNGKPLIVVCEEITKCQISSVLDRMKHPRIGLYSKAVQLDTNEKFLTHLILHEIAHLTQCLKEDEADEWAFAQMGIT